jgi:hypothetical protein
MIARQRPLNRRASETFDIESQGLRFMATVSRFPGGSVAEVFLQNHKAGSMPPTPPLRNGNARTCASCGATMKPKRGSRRQRFCDAQCRSRARRERNFSATGHTGQGAARSAKIFPAISNTRKGENTGRAYPINLVGGYRWPGRNGFDAELARTIVRIEICAISILPLIDDGERPR